MYQMISRVLKDQYLPKYIYMQLDAKTHGVINCAFCQRLVHVPTDYLYQKTSTCTKRLDTVQKDYYLRQYITRYLVLVFLYQNTSICQQASIHVCVCPNRLSVTKERELVSVPKDQCLYQKTSVCSKGQTRTKRLEPAPEDQYMCLYQNTRFYQYTNICQRRVVVPKDNRI